MARAQFAARFESCDFETREQSNVPRLNLKAVQSVDSVDPIPSPRPTRTGETGATGTRDAAGLTRGRARCTYDIRVYVPYGNDGVIR